MVLNSAFNSLQHVYSFYTSEADQTVFIKFLYKEFIGHNIYRGIILVVEETVFNKKIGGGYMDTVKNYEADNATGYNHEGISPNMPVRRLTATSIIGDSVQNPIGEDLGRIDNLMINIRTSEVEYAVLQFGSVLGLGGKYFAIPFTELKLDASREVFIVNRDREYLKNIPGFDKSHWPDTNDHVYYNEVDDYWRTPPSII